MKLILSSVELIYVRYSLLKYTWHILSNVFHTYLKLLLLYCCLSHQFPILLYILSSLARLKLLYSTLFQNQSYFKLHLDNDQCNSNFLRERNQGYRIVGQDISWAESTTRNVGQNGEYASISWATKWRLTLIERVVKAYITRNLGQDGDRLCYLIQNGVARWFKIEWEVP